MSPRQPMPGITLILDSIASPTRLRMLKSLAQKKLGYSELAKAVGMDRDRDAGKFSYHLKKLLDSGLIEVDNSLGKYVLSSKGVLILRYLERLEEELGERSLMIVRRSDQLIEPFNKDKIADALVKEAKLPPKLAREVASIAERKLLDLKIDYLTAPLIRELVNSILLDMGLEKYRHKLTRLGMPLYDVVKLLKKSFKSNNWKLFLEKSSGNITREYLLLDYLPREVAELHLSGKIDIYPISNWIFGLFSKRFDLNMFDDALEAAAEILEKSMLIRYELRIAGQEDQFYKLLRVIGEKMPEKRVISTNFSEKIGDHILKLPEKLRRKLGILVSIAEFGSEDANQLIKRLNKLYVPYVLSLSEDVGFSGFLLDRSRAEIHSIVTLNLVGIALESRGDLDLTLSKISEYLKSAISIVNKGLNLSKRIHNSDSIYSLISTSGLMEASKYLARSRTQVIEEAVEIAVKILEKMSELISSMGDKVLLGGRCPYSAASRFRRIDAYKYGEKQVGNLLAGGSKYYSVTPLPILDNPRELDSWIEYAKKLTRYFTGGYAVNVKWSRSMKTLTELFSRISEVGDQGRKGVIIPD